MLIERRFVQQSEAEVRQSTAPGEQTMSGYAALFYNSARRGTEYPIAENMVERIRHGAFDRAISESHDVRALFNHSPDNLLGRSSSGTCRLSVDARGLRYAIQVNPDDPDHCRVIEKIKRGDLSGSSFAFRPTSVSWEEKEGVAIRWIEDVTLYDVGPVTYPAYSATTTALRHGDEQVEAIQKEYQAWKSAHQDWRLRWLKLVQLEAEQYQPEVDEMEIRRRRLAKLIEQ